MTSTKVKIRENLDWIKARFQALRRNPIFQLLGFIFVGVFYSFLGDLLHGFNITFIENSKTVLSRFLTFFIQLLNFQVSVYSLLLAFLTIWLVYKLYRRNQFKKNELKILEASYGSGNTFINITDYLNNAVQQDELKIVVGNNIAGDPTPGVRKGGVIKYMFKNEIKEINYTENDTIELP